MLKWVSYSAYAGLKCWVHGKWVGSRLAQRCVGGQSSHNMARIAGYCAGIGALEWAREGRLRVPGALRGALCALLATWCVLVKDDMAWVICAACCRGAHSRSEREASVGCRGLRCVWCVCGARASSRRRGLRRWGRVCGRHATHKYTCLCGRAFFVRCGTCGCFERGALSKSSCCLCFKIPISLTLSSRAPDASTITHNRRNRPSLVRVL